MPVSLGFFFTHSRYSRIDEYGLAAEVVATSGVSARCATGIRSLSGSNCSLS